MVICDYRYNPDEEEFLQFVQDVRNDFDLNWQAYLQQAQDAVPEITVIFIKLAGSYGPGRMPLPDSDIDLEVIYFPNEKFTPEDVAEALYEKIEGYGGPFDIIPHEATELNEEPFIEIQSDLFRESGCNVTDIHQIKSFVDEMYEFGWDHFNPVYGTILTVNEQDLEDYQEASEGGYEHELAWSRPLREEDIGREYVSISDGHHRAWAAKNTSLPIRVYE